jgi:hypothetical protein
MARSEGRNTLVWWTSAGSYRLPQRTEPRSYFNLGGFLNLSGLTPDALSAPHYAISRLIYYRKVGFGGEGFLNVPLYLGASLEAGNAELRGGRVERVLRRCKRAVDHARHGGAEQAEREQVQQPQHYNVHDQSS